MDVSSLSRRDRSSGTRIRPITDRPWLFPSSFALTPIGFPYGLLSLTGQGEVRGCHVPQKYPDRLGAAFTPKAQHLRQKTKKSLYLAIHLLVQAIQHLWLVLLDDACSDLPMFTIRSNLSALPPWCWQS